MYELCKYVLFKFMNYYYYYYSVQNVIEIYFGKYCVIWGLPRLFWFKYAVVMLGLVTLLFHFQWMHILIWCQSHWYASANLRQRVSKARQSNQIAAVMSQSAHRRVWDCIEGRKEDLPSHMCISAVITSVRRLSTCNNCNGLIQNVMELSKRNAGA